MLDLLHTYFSEIPRSRPDRWLRAEQVEYAGRRADFMALDRYESSGCPLHWVEVKVSRDDWLRELYHPRKANVFKLGGVDFQWLAVSDPDIVRLDRRELPYGWGLLVAQDGKLHCVRPPENYRLSTRGLTVDEVRQARAVRLEVIRSNRWDRDLVAGFCQAMCRTPGNTGRQH